MTAILAIDAAWTVKGTSGVALVTSTRSGWRCAAVAASYDDFLVHADGVEPDWSRVKQGSAPDVSKLLSAAERIAEAPVDLVTIDMPIATKPIRGRREADQAVSRIYGGRGCSAHSPNATRPGDFGVKLSNDLVEAGFQIATTSTTCGTLRHLVEVYPHPALLSLLDRKYRVEYKLQRSRRYWPADSPEDRRRRLLDVWWTIHEALAVVFDPLGFRLPVPCELRGPSELKRFEDALDALICAWVGVRYGEGAAEPLGDCHGAIWCPFATRDPGSGTIPARDLLIDADGAVPM